MNIFPPPISSDGRLTCRFCDQLIDAQELSFANAYWQITGIGKQPKYPCHRNCKKSGMQREAYDCQCIDRSCNDCRDYKREGRPAPPSPLPTDRKITDEEQRVYLFELIKTNYDSHGTCLRFNKRVTTNPNMCEAMSCFTHRKQQDYEDKMENTQ